MNKFEGILIVSDVDGTLVDCGELSDENVKAIKYFTQNGGLFTVATGRTPLHIMEHYIPRLAINAPLIAINGALVADVDGKKTYWEQKLTKSVEPVLKRAKEYVSDCCLYVYNSENRLPVEGADLNNIYKILITCNTEEETIELKNKLASEFPEFYFSRSWNTGLEATDISANKGVAIKKLKEITGSAFSVAMGNFENDYTLLKGADLSVAVCNSSPDILEIADVITKNGAKNAVAECIYMLEEKYCK